MKSLLAFLVIMTLASSAVAQTHATPLRDTVRRTPAPAVRMLNAPSPRAIQSHDSWAARHPALLGALIGLGVGLPIGYATCKYPGTEGSCSYYTYPERARLAGAGTIGGIGAGAGAGVGALIGAAR